MKDQKSTRYQPQPWFLDILWNRKPYVYTYTAVIDAFTKVHSRAFLMANITQFYKMHRL